MIVARNLGDRDNESKALCGLGMAYNGVGDFLRAIDFHLQYLDIARQLDDSRYEAGTLFNIAIALSNLGLQDQANIYAEASRALFEKIGDPLAVHVQEWLLQWRELIS